MIRLTIISKDYQNIKKSFSQLLLQESIEHTIRAYQQKSIYDIYIIDIYQKSDLQILDTLDRNVETLIYVIGPKDFELANECIQYNVHLYFVKENLESDIQKFRGKILKHIQERFQYYVYSKRGVSSKIRLSQIYYIESLRHQIVIHALEGEFMERKNLSDFMNHVSSKQFIQIHRSFVINRQYIQKITNQEILLKNNTVLPIGKTYKKMIML